MRLRTMLLAGAAVALTAGSAAAQESLTISFDTTPAGGNYDPTNIVAVWVEDTTGGFVKTLGRWADRRVQHLVAWGAASGSDTDAISGATRPNHTQRLTVTWDMTDRNGTPVPNGNYTVRMELADRNSTSPDQNNQGTFAFVKDGVAATQNDANGGFENVTLDYAVVVSETCGNGTLDDGETCDPVDTCPTECAPSGDACIAVALVGTAANCDAECIEQPVVSCADGDGCCPSGCTYLEDDDCDEGVDPADPTGDLTSTGCRVGGGGGGAWALALAMVALALLGRRRRR